MFRNLTNAVRIDFQLQTRGPLLIRSGGDVSLDPTRPDMSFVRTHLDGEESVFLPGASLKGVMRSQYERLINAMLPDDGPKCCNITNRRASCYEQPQNKAKREELADVRYRALCPACRLFGSLLLGSRIWFTDAYPEDKPMIGVRSGVGIDRITGGASNGALYDYEVVEQGSFHVRIRMENIKLYQLKMVLLLLDEIEEGYIRFGLGSSRGNGQMGIADARVVLRDHTNRTSGTRPLRGFNETSHGGPLNFVGGDLFSTCGLSTAEAKECLRAIDICQGIREEGSRGS